jgi:transcriptional antiterminator NusG
MCGFTSYGPWVALQVRPKAEKIAAQHLGLRGFEYFLPTWRPSYGSDKASVEMPLFPGYVFCRFDMSATARMVATPGVSRIVSFDGEPAYIDEREIAAIRQTIASGQYVLPLTDFVPGTNVVIVDGPLRGVRGVVLRLHEKRFLVVSLSLLGRSVAVEMNPSWVRRLIAVSDRPTYTAASSCSAA